MKDRRTHVAIIVALLLGVGPTAAGALKCPPDSAAVGPTCVDRYEASVWQIDPGATANRAGVCST